MILKQIRDDTRGAALVEAAVTLPVFTLMIFGIMWAGLLIFTQVWLQHSVEMAARWATIQCGAATCATSSSIDGFATTQFQPLGGPAPNYTPALCANSTGIGVTGTYAFNLFTLRGSLPIPSITLSAQSCYPCQTLTASGNLGNCTISTG
jgi:Flp pilus assembly protein TadG